MFAATRKCSEDNEWESPDVFTCESESFKMLETKVQNMNQPNTTTLISYADELKTITNASQPILPRDVLTASKILDELIK